MQMSSTEASKEDEHFDEPALETIKKEFKIIGQKIIYVILLLPKHREASTDALKQWDLWGPLIICIFFSLCLALTSSAENGHDDFVNVFLMFWIGGSLVSLNCRLLGAKGSLLQYLSAVGYCVIPLAIIGFLVSILHSILPSFLKFIILIIALLWSIVSCLIVMRDIVHEDKKWLCAYPIFLFYIFMAWYAIVV